VIPPNIRRLEAMTSMTSSLRARARRVLGASILAIGAIAAGCSSDLLSVEDPDVIAPDNLGSPSAATALRNGVIARLTTATSGANNDNIFLFGGLLADEWRSGDTFEQRNTTDQRVLVAENSFLDDQFRDLQRVRNEAERAIALTRQYQPTNVTGIGLMFAIRAYATVLIAEHFCNGIPFSRLDGLNIVFGNPVSVDSAFGMAMAEADSAIAAVPANDRAARMARVVKARALLNRGQFAAAATAIGGAGAATGVPSTFSFSTYHSTVTGSNQLWSLNTSAKRYVVSPAEGTVGLNFRGAADPRLPTSTTGGPNAFDSATPFFAQTKWARYDSVVIVSGIEARLIEAEAQWRTDTTAAGGNMTTVTNLLNAIRTASGVAGLTPLAVPATSRAMTDLLFRERAFWMYSTGHRLGDLRRLMRQYGRTEAETYPNGAYHKGGTYGTMKVIPVPFDEENNPNYSGCTNLDP